MINNLKFMRTALLVVMTMAIFASCQKDEIIPPVTKDPASVNFFQMQDQQRGNDNNGGQGIEEDSLDMDCVSIVYPVQVIFPDGATQDVNSDDELETTIITWLNQNPTAEEFPTFNFPIEVTLEDGTTQSVSDEETLCELFEECWDDDDILIIDDSTFIEEPFCFDFVYPVDVSLPDGTTQTANNEEEMGMIVFTWFEQNPNSSEFPSFVFPLTVITEDGEETTVEDEDGFEDLIEDCYEDYHEDCFTINYPVQIIFPDGVTADVNSDDELEEAVENWYDQNPNNNEDPTFNYPIEVTMEDGTISSVNSNEELEALFTECYGDECEFDGEGLILGDGATNLTKVVVKRQAKN